LKSIVILGALTALTTGLAISTQSTLGTRIGAIIGTFRTGLMMNAIGGSIAGIVIILLLFFQGRQFLEVPPSALRMLVIAGTLGILIISGVAFSLQRTGVAAGLATIILGQLTLSVVIDANGWGSTAPIPISWQRALGLLLMVVAIFLLLPKD
jgi:transporter family-2 protein